MALANMVWKKLAIQQVQTHIYIVRGQQTTQICDKESLMG